MNNPTIEERRKHRRMPVRLPATIQIKSKSGKVYEGEITDLSESGAFVHCTVPIVIGEEVDLEIRFRDTKVFEAKVIDWEKWLEKNAPEDLHEKSVVRWARGSSHSGFGVEFVSTEPDLKKFLCHLIDYFENLSKAGVSFK